MGMGGRAGGRMGGGAGGRAGGRMGGGMGMGMGGAGGLGGAAALEVTPGTGEDMEEPALEGQPTDELVDPVQIEQTATEVAPQ